jgi:hypothetical protein
MSVVIGKPGRVNRVGRFQIATRMALSVVLTLRTRDSLSTFGAMVPNVGVTPPERFPFRSSDPLKGWVGMGIIEPIPGIRELILESSEW